MLMDVDMNTLTTGVAGGLDLGNTAIFVTEDGVNFEPSNSKWATMASQSVYADKKDTTQYVTGDFLLPYNSSSTSGSGVVFNSGTNLFKHSFWGIEATEPPAFYVLPKARYGAYPSKNTFYVSGGSWALDSNKVDAQDGAEIVYQFNDDIFVRADRGLKYRSSSSEPQTQLTDGYSAAIAKSVDGGLTWTTQFLDYGKFYFNGIDCIDENTCWAVGEATGSGSNGGRVYFTNNGGEQWEEIYFDPNAQMFQVKMIDSLNGWVTGAFGFRGAFYRTRDGCKSFEIQVVDGIQSINNIEVVSESLAYATAFTSASQSAVFMYTE